MDNIDAVEIEKLNTSGNLFGINEDAFIKILEKNNSSIAINNIKQIDYINKDYYGGRGDKIVVKVEYNNGILDKQTDFFIKKHCNKNPNEAIHNIYLTAFHAPIPKLYAYFSKENYNDIIVTEVVKPFYVDDDPVFMLDKNIFEPFVKTTALFNSVKINDEYRNILINNYNLIEDSLLPLDIKLRTMFESIKSIPIYRNLNDVIINTTEVAIIKLHEKICISIAAMEKGLYHWDHKPRNMGWSDLQDKYILFDLEDTLWEARFFNIGMWLGGEDKVEKKYIKREKLAQIYLDIYNDNCKEKVSVDCLLSESYPLWIAYKIQMLMHYYYEAGEKPYAVRDSEPREYKKRMENMFITTLDLLCKL